METRILVLGLLAPFALFFLYAAWSEYRRFNREGGSSYGLHYDEDTNTTHVGALPDTDAGFDPEHFVPDELEQRAAEADDRPTTPSDDPEQDRQ